MKLTAQQSEILKKICGNGCSFCPKKTCVMPIEQTAFDKKILEIINNYTNNHK